MNICKFIRDPKLGTCPQGDKCQYAHSAEEALPLCVSPGAFGQWAVTFPLDSKARDRAGVEDKKKRS